MGNSIAKDEDSLAVFLDLLKCGPRIVLTKSRILRPSLQPVSGFVSNLTRNGVLFIIKQAGRSKQWTDLTKQKKCAMRERSTVRLGKYWSMRAARKVHRGQS
jgi:hypothetical protein